VSGPADAGSTMDREAEIPLLRRRRLARVDSDPHPHVRAVRPPMAGQRPLNRDRCRHRISGAAEGDEERVALRVDHLAPMRGEDLAEQPLLVGQELAVPSPAQPFQQPGRALDVREQEGDGPAKTLRREPPCPEASSATRLVSNHA
jgi:hypothetical protein